MNSTNILATRAMLAHPSFGRWGASKVDKQASTEATTRAKAKDGAARVTKRLVAEGVLDAITDLDGEAYQYHKRVTLPWLDNGARLLNVSLYPEYTQKMNDFREKREDLVRAFVAGYADILRDAPGRLGALYKAADYPSEGTIGDKFKFVVRLFPIPTGDDWRVGLDDDAVNLLRKDLEQQTNEALNAAIGDAYRRVAEVCEKMVDRLNAYKPKAKAGDKAAGIFRDSLVTNVRDLVALLPILNITNDPRLTALAEAMERDLCFYDAEELRENDHARATTAQAAQAILDSVSQFFA